MRRKRVDKRGKRVDRRMGVTQGDKKRHKEATD